MEDRSNNYSQSKTIDTGSYHQTGQQTWLCNGYLMEAREEEDVQGRPDDKHSRIYSRRESAGVMFAEC